MKQKTKLNQQTRGEMEKTEKKHDRFSEIKYLHLHLHFITV